ncbi:MAG: T9SS type A sorting domain-containing protein [Bacteroidota bacterium]
MSFQPGSKLVVDWKLDVSGITLAAANPTQGWGGIDVPVGGDIVFRDDLRVLANQTLRLRGAGDYEFTNGAQIVVEGAFDAGGVAFQAQNGNGWGGIRFESGSSGILSGGSITGVSNPCGTGACLDDYAVSLNNASVVMNDLRITTPIGSGVGGIYAYGQNTLLDMERVEVRDMTGRGLGLVNRATARVRSSRFVNNLGDGISVLNRATAFIRQAEENFPAEISDNGLRGILAASRGTAILGEQGGCSAPFCASAATDGYALVEANDREGLRINSNSTINAGGANAHRFNTIRDNDASQVRVFGSGADLFMNADFWGGGEPVPNASNGGAFFYTSYCLDEPTFGQGCTIEDVDSVPTRQGGASAEAFYALAEADALRAQGRTNEAALAFADLARRYPGTPEATSSLARLGRLTSELDAPAQRQTLRFLDGETRQRGAVHEHAALAALAGALADLGQTEAAVAVAADLTVRTASLRAADFGGSVFDTAIFGDEDPMLEAQIVGPETAFYAWMDAEDFAAAEASWAELAALAPDHEATAAAREAFAFVVGRVPAGAARAGGATARAMPAQKSVTVWPNPAGARATVGVALAEEAVVRVTVVDVLGREVAVVHAGRLAAGRHTLAFDTRSLAAGVYVVRAEQPSGATTTRLTVVR